MARSKSKKEEAKTEEQQLQDYELVIVVSPETAEDALEAALNNVNQFITGKGGIISEAERWGKRKLAYPIKSHLEGNYVLTRCRMRPAWAKELDANLNISEDVLRHLLLKVAG